MWPRLADVLPRSAPGAAFTAAVLLALPLAASASAATLASAGAVGAAGATAKAGVKPLGAAGAAVGYFSLGLAGAVGSMFRNARQLESFAEDPLERRALSLYRKLAIAAVLFFGALIYATVTAGGSVLWVGAAALGYLLIVNSLYFWWLPQHAPKAVAARSLQHPRQVRLERLRRVLVSIILFILALLYANMRTSCARAVLTGNGLATASTLIKNADGHRGPAYATRLLPQAEEPGQIQRAECGLFKLAGVGRSPAAQHG